MLKIYHHPGCAKSRAGLDYLKAHNYEFEIIYYMDDHLNAEDIRRILMKLNMKPLQIVRTQEELYRHELKGRSFTDEEWIRIIAEYPKLLQRPVVEGKYRAVIAMPPERIEKII
jgi:arsenate reductase (glutaredoxin)